MADTAANVGNEPQNGGKKTSDDIPEQILENIPKDQRETAKAVFHAIRAERFEGPIPHPKVIGEYEHVLPGSASRIIAMAENQQAHRQRLEAIVVESNIRREQEGLRLGFILALVMLIGSIALIFAGKEVIGLGAILGEGATFAGVFVYAQRQGRLERKEQQQKILQSRNKNTDQ